MKSIHLLLTSLITNVNDDQLHVFWAATTWMETANIKEVRLDFFELLASLNLEVLVAYQTCSDPAAPPSATSKTALTGATFSTDGVANPLAWEDISSGIGTARYVRFGFAIRRKLNATSSTSWGQVHGRIQIARRC